VGASDVEALVLGEHGVSSVFLWSSARVGGRKVLDLFGESPTPQTVREELEREVRYANITIIEGIGASQYGIGMVSARLTEMVLRDEGAVIPVGYYNAKFGVTLSLPSVIGREGVHRVLEPEMSAQWRGWLRRREFRHRPPSNFEDEYGTRLVTLHERFPPVAHFAPNWRRLSQDARQATQQPPATPVIVAMHDAVLCDTEFVIHRFFLLCILDGRTLHLPTRVLRFFLGVTTPRLVALPARVPFNEVGWNGGGKARSQIVPRLDGGSGRSLTLAGCA